MESATNPKVDWYFAKSTSWRTELETLRTLVLGCGLTEELKWGVPCYSFRGGNIVLVHEFKHYCAILFVKGALLQDSEGVLVQQTEHTQSARQLRFTNVREITAQTDTIRTYVYEAIAVEEAGLKVALKAPEEFPIAEELQQQFDVNPALKAAFEALTPGRRREYLLYFSAAKQAKTRVARVEKYTQHILDGKGMQDDYMMAAREARQTRAARKS
jgi:uncharacterized protein YdeI (YjbR/CyaY-like superfamily)